MGIKRDVSDVPRGGEPGGTPPDPFPRYVVKLAEAWHESYDNSMANPANPKDRWRASEGGQCARSVGYGISRRDAIMALAEAIITGDQDQIELAGELVDALAVSNPPSLADSWRFQLGTMVHGLLEVAVTKAFPTGTVTTEKVIDYRHLGIEGSGRADIVHDAPVHVKGDEIPVQTFRTHIELKTINGFGFKTQATNFKGFPEGPRASHLVQGALNAFADGADELVIGYLSLELLSVREAERQGASEVGRFAAEWTYTREEFEPIARAEIDRIRSIVNLVDRGVPVPRMIPELPANARVVNPRTGLWTVSEPVEVGQPRIVNSGTTWHCGYCRDQDRCAADEA